jgi:hypothetical protein
MQVRFTCDRCEAKSDASLEGSRSVKCRRCGNVTVVPEDAVQNGRLARCAICPSHELYVSKDFPQKVGVSIVVIGFAASCIPWYFKHPGWTMAVLFATAAADLLLYLVVGNVLTCYSCHAQYRGLAGLEGHEPFQLETHERHRQRQARLAETAPVASPTRPDGGQGTSSV